MIPVRETKDGFEVLAGNPTLDSIDGEWRAPLHTILSASWTDDERAKYGVFLVEPVPVPDGKEPVGMATYKRQRGGKVVQVREFTDKAPPSSEPTELQMLRSDLEALAKRVLALEGGQ